MSEHAFIAGIEYTLPSEFLSAADLSKLFPIWSVESIERKTGIERRPIASPEECASDLAVLAVNRLFDSGVCKAGEIDYLLFCTQSPDYVLPTTACLLQDRLGLRTSVGALDYNLGCSGFVYGLGLAEGLISSGQAKAVLLVTADTYSKYIDPSDRQCRTLFGDGACATLLRAMDDSRRSLGPFVYGTDGTGADDIVVPNSGARRTDAMSRDAGTDEKVRDSNYLFMNSAHVFHFVLQSVPRAVNQLLDDAGMNMGQIDLFIFHQANAFMLEELRKKIGIPAEKFHITLKHCGNTVSSTIPIAIKHAEMEGKLKENSTLMLVGFGVGYSWSATLARWQLPISIVDRSYI